MAHVATLHSMCDGLDKHMFIYFISYNTFQLYIIFNSAFGLAISGVVT